MQRQRLGHAGRHLPRHRLRIGEVSALLAKATRGVELDAIGQSPQWVESGHCEKWRASLLRAKTN